MSAIAVETLKVRSVRAAWGIIAATGVIVMLALVLAGSIAGEGSPELLDGAEAQRALFDLGQVSVFGWLLGVIIVNLDVRSGTVVPHLLTAPVRRQYVLGKVGAGILAAVAMGVVTAAATGVTVPAIIRANGGTVAMAAGDLTALWLRGMVVLVLAVLSGVGLALLLWQPGVALVVPLVLTFVLTPLIVGALPTVGRWLPATLEQAITQTGDSPLNAPIAVGQQVSAATATGTLVVLTGALVALGGLTFARRDLQEG